jgi:hypothetical protein
MENWKKTTPTSNLTLRSGCLESIRVEGVYGGAPLIHVAMQEVDGYDDIRALRDHQACTLKRLSYVQ